jgi:hypothetical protein
MSHTLYNVILLAGAIFATGVAEPGRQPKIPVPVVPQLPPGEIDPKMPFFFVCAKACDDCARHCEMCVAHCAKLVADGKKEHHHTLQLCQDCAAICQAASRVTAKDGPMSDLIVASCADACKRCGDACEKHAGDPIMKRCADECRKCEKACREMHKTAKSGGQIDKDKQPR